MPIILARLLPEYAPTTEPPAVHAYPVEEDTSEATVLKAACGQLLPPGQGEQVEAFTGTPCTPCLVLVSNQRYREQHTTSEQDQPPQTPAAGAASAEGRYAVGLRGERVCHLVPQRPITGALESRSVVQTVCGCLAWGPLLVAPQWPFCGDCGATPDEALS